MSFGKNFLKKNKKQKIEKTILLKTESKRLLNLEELLISNELRLPEINS